MNCINCNQVTNNPKFCSRRCSAILTNKTYPKKKKIIRHCMKCGVITIGKRKCCENCRRTNSTLLLSKKESLTSDTQRYRRIRSSARIVARSYGLLDSCGICGYSLFVETCHIKPISSFSDSTLLSEINDPNNLIGLCPNHHWEYDNGYLKLNEASERIIVDNICDMCGVLTRRKRCRRCSGNLSKKTKINWPSISYVVARANEIGYLALSRELGVSDNAIRKHIKKHSR